MIKTEKQLESWKKVGLSTDGNGNYKMPNTEEAQDLVAKLSGEHWDVKVRSHEIYISSKK